MALPRRSCIAAVLAAAVAAALAGAGPASAAFELVLTAGLANPAAGAFSPLTVMVEQPDGQPYITGLSVALPPGLLATIRDVEPCRERAAATGACGARARVGTVRVASVESGGTASTSRTVRR